MGMSILYSLCQAWMSLPDPLVEIGSPMQYRLIWACASLASAPRLLGSQVHSIQQAHLLDCFRSRVRAFCFQERFVGGGFLRCFFFFQFFKVFFFFSFLLPFVILYPVLNKSYTFLSFSFYFLLLLCLFYFLRDYLKLTYMADIKSTVGQRNQERHRRICRFSI